MRKATLILLLGIALRALVLWPTGVFPGDADEVLTGLTALRILDDRDAAVFYAGYRHGALESYLHVIPLALFGTSRNALAIAPFVSLCLALFFFWRLAVRIEGEERAHAPLLFAAFAPATLLWWIGMPNGYSLLFALGIAVLWLARRTEAQPTALNFALLGLTAGLALWCSPLALAPLGAAALNALLFARRRAMLAAIPAFLIGFAPWLVFNLRFGFVSLQSPYVGVGATSFAKLFTRALPELMLNVPLLLLVFAAVVLLAREWRRYFLPLATALFAMLMFAFSEAAAMTASNARYLLFVTPLAAFALGRFRRGWLVAVAVIWIGWQATAYVWPWTQDRRERVARLAVQQQLVQRLEARGIRSVAGFYWDVYPIAFDTRRAIAPVAYPLDADYHGQRTRAAAPWAVVISKSSERFVKPALRNLGIRGTTERVGAYEIVYVEADAAAAVRLADEAERLWRASLQR